jgi:hypothetical protein
MQNLRTHAREPPNLFRRNSWQPDQAAADLTTATLTARQPLRHLDSEVRTPPSPALSLLGGVQKRLEPRVRLNLGEKRREALR